MFLAVLSAIAAAIAIYLFVWPLVKRHVLRRPNPELATKADVERLERTIHEVFNHWRAVPEKSTEQLVAGAPPHRFRLLDQAATAQREHRYRDAVAHLRAALTPDLAAGERASLLILVGNSLLNLSELAEAQGAYEQAIAAAAEANDEQARGDAVGNLGSVYLLRGNRERAERHYRESLDIHRRIHSRLGEANQMGNLGLVYEARGDPDQAEEHFKQALEIHRKIDNPAGEANQLGNVGNVCQGRGDLGSLYLSRGDLDGAQEHHKQSLEIHRSIDNPLGQASALGNLGLVYADRGDLDRAEDHHKQSLEIHRRIDNPEGQAGALGNLGNVYAGRGDLERAEEHHKQALEIDRRIDNPLGQANDLGNLGLVYMNRGDLDKAEEHYRQVLHIHERVPNPLSEANALGNLGNVYLDRGDLERAEEHHKQALEIDRRIDNPLGQAQALGNLGLVYRRRGDLDRAEEHHKQALEIDRRIDNPLGQANQLGNLGNVYADRGDLDRAEEHHKQALEIDRRIDNPLGQANDLANLGLVAEERGQRDQARRLLSQALALYERIGAGGPGPDLAPATGYGWQHYVGDLRGLLDHVSVGRAHLAGISMGGAIALQFTLEAPGRVASLALLDSSLPGFTYSPEFQEDIERLRQAVRSEGPRAAMARHWLTHPLFDGVRRYPERFAALERMVLDYPAANYLDEAEYPPPDPPPIERLHEVSVPALIVAGETDLPDFLIIADILAENLSRARKVVVAGAGHLPNLERPDEANAALLSFLAAVEGEAG